MKPKVYLETTILGYLTALPSRDLIIAAHQQITRDWWEKRERFDLFVSRAVVSEAGAGDAEAAARRLGAVKGLPILDAGHEVVGFADSLIAVAAVPQRAAVDAVHIAIATLNGMDYLLTWNCAHIANAAARPRIEEACRAAGLQAPIICTPEELMED